MFFHTLLKKSRQELRAIFNNFKGFSIVQVMVAFGLMGGLSLMMMRMMESQNKQQKTMELKSEQLDLANIVRNALKDKESCEATFIGMSPGDTIKEIRTSNDRSLPAFAETGVKFRNSNVYIKSMYLLTRQEAIDANEAPKGYKINYSTGYGYAVLRVVFTRNIGVVSDANKTHNFYGAKDVAIRLQVNGYFYDREVVKAYPATFAKLQESCWQKASSHGVSCNSTDSSRCSLWDFKGNQIKDDAGLVAADQFTDSSSHFSVATADCHYSTDDSPFMACGTN